MKNIVLCLTMIVLLGANVLAQEDAACTTIVTDALAVVGELCEGTARNQVCYGHAMLDADPRPESVNFRFETPGDIVPVMDIATLRLSQMQVDTNEWGVALMRLQANLPDTIPGQNVTLLLFGDVTVETKEAGFDVTIPPANTINVRSGPSTGYALVGQIAPGVVVTATGRNEAGDWLRVTLPEDETGWIYAPLVDVSGEIESLGVVQDDDTVSAGVSQAYYFRTGIGDSACAEAPDSGILIQTPPDVENIQLVLNGANIELGSTVFVQVETGERMNLYTLEGDARITAFDTMRGVPAGTRITVPIDADATVSSAPEAPEPYTVEDVTSLQNPVNVLPEAITIADPLDQYGGLVTLHPEGCNPEVVHSGLVTLAFGTGGEPGYTYSDCEVVAARVQGMAEMTVNGMALSNYRSECKDFGDRAGGHTEADILLGPGTYTAAGSWGWEERSCSFTVVP